MHLYIFSVFCQTILFGKLQFLYLTMKRKKEEEREKVGNNGQLRIANSNSGGARKPPGQKCDNLAKTLQRY